MKPATASVFYVKDKTGNLLPVLVADDEAGNPRVVPEAVAFARTLRTKKPSSGHNLRSWITSLALFHDHIRLVQRTSVVENDGTPSLTLAESVWWFLQDRLKGVKTEDGAIDWPASKFPTVKRDHLAVLSFFRYCESRYRHLSLSPEFPFLSQDFKSACSALERISERRVQSLVLGHLEARKPKPAASPVSVPFTYVPSAPKQSHLSQSDVEKLILGTKSDVQKMAFILGAFGGIRGSEILHLWICDVIPGAHRPKYFPNTPACVEPLVILANPVHSTHVDELGTRNTSRLQWLQARGTLPRTMLPLDDGLRAGWKGMAIHNANLLISQVLWTDRAWASVFWDLFKRHRENTLAHIPSSVRTPYLFVNEDQRRLEFGRPMTLSNLRKSFDRAVVRAGLDSSLVTGIHCLRHFYTETLKRLSMSREDIQMFMHHRSPKSQDSYGNAVTIAEEKLRNAMQQRQQKKIEGR